MQLPSSNPTHDASDRISNNHTPHPVLWHTSPKYEIKITTWGLYTEMIGRVRKTMWEYELCWTIIEMCTSHELVTVALIWYKVDSFTKWTHFYRPWTSKNDKKTKNNLQYVPSYDFMMRHTSAAASFTSHETAFPVMDIVPRHTSAKPDARGLWRRCRILNLHRRGESGNRLTEASVRAAPGTDIHSIGI